MTSAPLASAICLALLTLSNTGLSAGPEGAPAPQESKEEKDARMRWWREARFGLFIHWGLYAVPAGEWNGVKAPGTGEWIMNQAKIKLADYRKLAGQFNPVRYDPEEWVRIAKDAGVKYVVITTKHHDGFCLWDSKATEYDVMSTPYGKDLLKPLADACRKEGLVFCVYHSIMDWQHPNYEPLPGWDQGRPGHTPNLDQYVTYMKTQLKELVDQVGPLGVMWFDGEWEATWTHERGLDLYNTVRSLQPGILVNNRVDKGRQGMQGLTKEGSFAGDFGTPEQEIPASGLPGVDWESCMTMNDTWGFRKDDERWKSSETLIRDLIDIASKGGNFLLNVGPTAEGLIPAASVERLAAMGQWLKTNGEAIYGTQASPLGAVPFGRVTAKPDRLYLHVFDWPASGSLEVSGIKGSVKRASLLADPKEKLSIASRENGTLRIELPKKAPDPVASVIVLRMGS